MLADLLQFAAAQPGDLELLEKYRARVGLQHAENEPQDRAFAAAALSHNDKSITALDIERHAVEHFFILEPDFYFAQFDHAGIGGAHKGKKMM